MIKTNPESGSESFPAQPAPIAQRTRHHIPDDHNIKSHSHGNTIF